MHPRTCACAALLAGFSSLVVGCSAPTVELGPDPDVVWWTDHETGDLGDWQSGSSSTWQINDGALLVESEQARSGTHALRASAAAAPSGTTSAAMLLRSGFPQQAYYSAWFYLPERAALADYWLIFKFRSRTADVNPQAVELWDLDLTPQGTDLELRVFQHSTPSQPELGTTLAPETRVPVPLAQWFQIEAYFRAAPDDTGELRIWQNGTLIHDLRGPSAPSPYVEWSAGSAAKSLESGEAAVFIDDAAVTLRQLGPNQPPFRRDP